MKLKITDILNKHKDDQCIIVGPGINQENDDYVREFKGIKISIGDIFLRLNDIKFDYIISCNGEFVNPYIEEQLNLINDIGSNFFFSEVECLRSVVSKKSYDLDKKLNVDYFIYDQRHIRGKKCFPRYNCCNYIKEDKSIFEIAGEIFNKDSSKCKSGGTVFEVALIFALLFGCKKIETLGITLLPKASEYKAVVRKNKYADDIHARAKEIIKKEIKNYYLKNWNVYPYIESFFNKSLMSIFNKTEISLEEKQVLKNLNFSVDIAKKNSINLIYHDENSVFKDIEGFNYSKLPLNQSSDSNNKNEIQIEDLIDKHQGEKCIIVGSSQSMHDFEYEKFSGKIILIGTSILRTQNRFHPDYLISANSHFPVPEIKKHLDLLNQNKKMTWIYSDSALYCDIWTKSEAFLKDNLKIKYLSFDERHFDGEKCKKKKNCCDFLLKYPSRINIFQQLLKINNINQDQFIFKKGASVAEAAVAFAIIMGFKEIYIQGVEMTLNKNYQEMRNKNDKYYGYPDKYADQFLKEDLKFLRKKYFKYYLKKGDFVEYIKSLYERIYLLITRQSAFFLDYEQSIKNFTNLFKIANKKGSKIFILSKNSNLKNIDGAL